MTEIPSRFQIDDEVSLDGVNGVVTRVAFSLDKVYYEVRTPAGISGFVTSEHVSLPRPTLSLVQ